MDDFNDILDSVLEKPIEILEGKKVIPVSKKTPPKSKISLESDPPFHPLEKIDRAIKARTVSVDKIENPKIIKDPLKKNKLLDIIKKKGFNSDLEKEALSIVAEEIAYLGAVREDQYQSGLDTSKISLRRVQSIQSLLEIIAKKQDDSVNSNGKAVFDFSSDTFRKVFKHILGIVSRTFDQVAIPDSYKQIFFVALSKNLENFEQEANAIVKGREVVIGQEVEKEDEDEEEDD